jgi:WD40 repeat protein
VRVNVDPSGQYATTASLDKWIRIVDIYSGEVLAKVTGHSELITGLKFLPDGRRLVSNSADGCIFVWRLPIETTSCITKRLEHLESKALPAPTEPALFDDPPLHQTTLRTIS